MKELVESRSKTMLSTQAVNPTTKTSFTMTNPQMRLSRMGSAIMVIGLTVVLSSCRQNHETVVFTTTEGVQIVGVDYGTDGSSLTQSFALRCSGSKKPFYRHDKNFFPGPDWNIGGNSSPKITETRNNLTLKGRDNTVTLPKTSFPRCK